MIIYEDLVSVLCLSSIVLNVCQKQSVKMAGV